MADMHEVKKAVAMVKIYPAVAIIESKSDENANYTLTGLRCTCPAGLQSEYGLTLRFCYLVNFFSKFPYMCAPSVTITKASESTDLTISNSLFTSYFEIIVIMTFEVSLV